MIRKNTYEDSEAKLFESLEKCGIMVKIKQLTFFQKEECVIVANLSQIIKKHPEAKVNIVSGKLNTGNPWKGRKPYD